jgi:tripartite-type tricarboxylate transporter receptor subunit TctC
VPVAVALIAALAALSVPAIAQTYPSRPISLIVPFPPGGSTTIVARIIGEKMSETLGQTVVIDNRGGAGGTVGTRAAAKSAPDGYTIVLSYTGTMAIGPTMHAAAGYDPRKDFAPIGRIGSAPMVIVVHPDVKAKTVAELIKLVRSDPNPFQYGSAGVGTVGHLAFTNVPVAHGSVASGKLRAVAVASTKRSAMMPDIPTVAESGLPGYEAGLLYGLAAPAGTPQPIIDRLNKELRAALATAEVRKRLATEGADALPSSPQEYAADIDREEIAWSKLLKSIGLAAK